MATAKKTTATKTTATKTATPKTTTTRARKAPVKKKDAPTETSMEIRKVDNGFIVDIYTDSGSETSVFLDTSTSKMVSYLNSKVSELY